MHTIKSVGVLSVAKIMGAIHAVLGLLVLPFALLVGMLASMAPHQNGQNPFGPFMGIAFAVMAPIFYGIAGFIFGAIGVFLYNIMANRLGGIEVRTEFVGPAAHVAPMTSQP
jgi:hypothetical protein